jgi:hypothetical protein
MFIYVSITIVPVENISWFNINLVSLYFYASD